MRIQRTAGFAARTTAAFLAIIATLALLAPAAFAQNEYLVGRKVMTIKWAAEFRLGKRVVSNEELGEVFTVDKQPPHRRLALAQAGMETPKKCTHLSSRPLIEKSGPG